MITAVTCNKSSASFEELAFNSFFAHPEIGVFISALNGTFLKVNTKFCELVGYTQEELLKMTLDQLSFTENEGTVSSANCNSTLQQQESFAFEKRVLKKDKSSAWLYFAGSLIADSSVNSYQYITTVHDISSSKHNEKELRNTNVLLDRVFDTTSALIAYLDINFNFIRVNKQYAIAGNHPPEFYIGKNHFNLYPNEENEIIFRRVVETGQAISFNAKPFVYKEYPELGTTYWDWDLIPVKNSENCVTGLVFCLVDVTERKKAEYASNAKSEYIANMSHELKTPLNVILSAIQLFDMYFKHDPSSKLDKIPLHLKSMRQNCYRLLRLVNNLIDTTKVDADFYDLKLGNYDIVKIVETLTLSVSDYVKNKGIELTFDSTVDKKLIAFDIDIVERIMLNLLSNAIKFTEPGGTIRVNVIDKAESIVVSVKDNGIGIHNDKQQTIFERYKQADQLLTRRHEGSGIGLSLTKSFVEMLGGKISLISEFGHGSEFLIELPCRLIPKADFEPSDKYISKDNKTIEKIIVELSDIYSINTN